MILCKNRWPRATQIGFLVAVTAIGGGAALAEEEPEAAPEMRADIERLMEVTKAYDSDTTEQMARMMSQQIGQMIGLKSTEAIERCQEITFRSVDQMFTDSDFMDQMNAIYARHFSHENIRQMIAFYETPAGKRWVEVMPQLMSESMQVTFRWLAKMSPMIRERVAKEMREEGLIE